MQMTEAAKFRAHQWVNTKTLKPIYSIQARVGKNGWANLHEGGRSMFYETPEARDAAMKELDHDD